MVRKKRVANKYKYNLNDEAYYTGCLYDMYKNKECKILSRSRSRGVEWYRVKIKNSEEVLITVGALSRALPKASSEELP